MNIMNCFIPYFRGEDYACQVATDLFDAEVESKSFICEKCKKRIPPKVYADEYGIFVETNAAHYCEGSDVYEQKLYLYSR